MGRPTLAGTYRVTFAFRQGDRVDDYSIAVTAECPEGHTQQSDRSCEAPTEAVCTQRLGNGTVSSGALELDDPGTWEQSCDLAARRRAGDSTYYAKHYTFNLQMDAEVTIDLTSGTDAYLFLLRGHGAEGTEIDAESLDGDGSCVPVVEFPSACAASLLGGATTWWGRAYYEGPYATTSTGGTCTASNTTWTTPPAACGTAPSELKPTNDSDKTSSCYATPTGGVPWSGGLWG